EAESTSVKRKTMQLILAFNYGGRREIVDSSKKIAAAIQSGELNPDDLDEDNFREYLYLPDVPDPDLIIRPSGEQRLSNFLLWQAAYSELYFAEVLWPDFSADILDEALDDYSKRDRRFGAIDKKE
ncbi:MAG: polyprenyl diphosphate synthase, partial [Eubacteriales bacterium]|nr:polyprenyl diphosphate synthase [Eubacteriales bacterium]